MNGDERKRMMKVVPFDAYRQYLSLKNHFTKDKYDYHKYCGKSRATVQSFYKRKDRFWFEKLARNKYNLKKLHADYWFNQINSKKEGVSQ